jgi:Protein of unknown function (DUF2726)
MDFSVLESTQTGLVALAALGAALLYWAWRRSHVGKTTTPPAGRPRTLDAVDTVVGWPPDATRVLTVRHQRAFEVLSRALPDHLILAQVPISHFVKVPTRHSYVEWLRRVGHVCVDLMICDSTSNVLAVVEIRPADRVETERARKRHMRVERVLRAAGIPLHVWNEALLPDPSAVRKAFAPEAEPSEIDAGPDTSPLEPTLYGPGGRTRGRSPAETSDDLPGFREPPRSTWFDELNATRPNALDGADVTTHDIDHHGSSVGGLHPATGRGAMPSHR